MIKKYLSLERLTEYDGLLKTRIDSGDSSTLSSAKTYTNTEIAKITNGTTKIKEAEHADSASEATHAVSADSATTATSATKATQDGNGKVISSTYETKTDASAKLAEAKEYTDTAVSGKADTTHNHDTAYDKKGAADTALASAKTYADDAAAKVKNDLLDGAGTAYDTLKELGALIDDNQDAIEALETIASGKADATHTHTIANVSGLQSALDGKAATSHGTHVTFDSTNKPKMDGTAAFGTATTVSRSDHVHPTDTSRASKTEFDTHVSDTTKHITSTERTNWGTAYTHSQAAHAPSNAEKNQNAFSNVKVGTTTIAADTTTDTLTLVAGANVTITPDANGDSITIAATDTKITVDSALSATSINPVQNKVINSAITTLTSTVSANTNSINSHTTSISALQTVIDEIQEITSAEVQALFSA